MEFNVQININVKLTETGEVEAMKLHGSKVKLIEEFKKGFKELILNELQADIETGLIEININATNY